MTVDLQEVIGLAPADDGPLLKPAAKFDRGRKLWMAQAYIEPGNPHTLFQVYARTWEGAMKWIANPRQVWEVLL